MCSVLPGALIQANRRQRNAKFEENSLFQSLHSASPPPFWPENGKPADAKDVKVPPPYGYEQGRPEEILTAAAYVFNEQKHLRNLFYSSKR